MCIRDRPNNYKGVANLIINKIKPWCQEEKISISDFPIKKENVVAFVKLIDEGKVSSSIAYQRLFPALITQNEKTPLQLAEEMDLIQSNDESELLEIVNEVLDKNPDKVTAYKKGKKNLIGFFMGEVMRSSKGKAEPKSTNALLRKILES